MGHVAKSPLLFRKTRNLVTPAKQAKQRTFFIQIMQGSSYNITRSFYLLIYFIIQNCCQQYVKLQKLLKPLEPKKTLELLKPPGPPKLKKLLELLKLLELCYQPRNKATRTEATVLGKGNSVWKKTVFWAIISFFFNPPKLQRNIRVQNAQFVYGNFSRKGKYIGKIPYIKETKVT